MTAAQRPGVAILRPTDAEREEQRRAIQSRMARLERARPINSRWLNPADHGILTGAPNVPGMAGFYAQQRQARKVIQFHAQAKGWPTHRHRLLRALRVKATKAHREQTERELAAGPR